MKHYEQRLETDVANIRDHVDELATSVVDALNNSIQALLDGNDELASKVVLADGPINRKMREIDAICHSFIAVHLPSGKHLRLISSIIRINITLERMGDYAVTIARELIQLNERPTGAIAHGIRTLGEHSMGILSQALHAFKRDDAELARQTMKLTHQTIPQFNDVLSQLVGEESKRNITDLFALFVVFHHLVRVSDQSKNICEDVVFSVTGETKAKKVYKILFIDEDDGCLTQMAKAIGNKSHSAGGEFHSAGRNPAPALHSGLDEFMDQRGVNLDASKPGSIQDLASELDDFHVIVSLRGKARTYLDKVPFHTTLLDWDIGETPAEGSEACDLELDNAYRQLAIQISDLMMLLRGDEASQG